MRLKGFILIAIMLSQLTGSDRTVKSGDIVSFTASDNIRELIKQDVIRDLNLTYENVKSSMEKEVEAKFERAQNIYKSEVLALQKEVKLLKEEVDLFRDMIVDTNYQRNLRDDKVNLLIKRVEELQQRVETLEEKKQPPITNKSGEKI